MTGTMIATRRRITHAAFAAALAAANAANAAHAGPPAAPALLSQTGLYAPSGTTSIDPRNRAFAPQYPLWSDGAGKRRWIDLPPGTTIDAHDDNAWSLPVGTRLWKEFVFDGRRVETRMLWRADPDTWVAVSYVWNDQQTDATLAPAAGIPGYVEIAPGKRHDIPGVLDCHACHDNDGADGPAPLRPLGFTALQLSPDRDPLAPHAEPLAPGMLTLDTLAKDGLLSGARADLLTVPPRIAAADSRTRAVLGYLSTNCGSCHNPSSSIADLGLDLARSTLATTLDVPGTWEIPSLPRGATRRVVPGDPDASSLLYRMASRRPSSQMPPLGTALADTDAIELVRAWIADGAGTHPPAP